MMVFFKNDVCVKCGHALGFLPDVLDISALENTADGYAPRPEYRPVTKFERRGLRLGHGVWDLVFRKRGAA